MKLLKDNNIGVFLISRYNSKRLKNKASLKVKQFNLVEILIIRILTLINSENVVICSSKTNNKLTLKRFLLVLFISCLAALFRFYIDDIFIVSYLASFVYGIALEINIKKSIKDLILIGFCASFSTFSGFIPLIYELILASQYLKCFYLLNITIMLSLFFMYCGFIIGKRFN